MKPLEKIAATTGAVWNLLIVDADAKVAEAVRKAAGQVLQTAPNASRPATAGAPLVRVAGSVDAAEAELSRAPADVLLLNLEIGGRTGTDLIRQFKRRFPATDVVVLSRSRRNDTCVDAWRAGAGDFVHAPIAAGELERVLGRAAERRQETEKRTHRYRRLREACKRLNKARHEISQQVDLLCNDLVRAYQDMAHQLNLTQTAAEYAQTLANELDVEGVLRRTMEWVLKKLGPVNAAIYVPSGESNFALGAYLNLDTHADATLIETLGRTIVQQARGTSPVWIEEERVLEELFDDDSKLLGGRQWLAVGCHTPRECLAVLVVFRGKASTGAAELTPASRGLLEAIAPILAEKMEQALGLYQRLHPYSEEEQEES